MEAPDPDYILRGFTDSVTSLTFVDSETDTQSDLLVAGTQNGALYVWDLYKRRIAYKDTSLHSNTVLSVAFIDSKKEIISRGREGVVCRWKLENGNIGCRVASYPCADFGFCPIAVFTMGNQPAVALPTTSNSDIAIIAIDTGDTMATLSVREQVGMPMDIKAADDGQLTVGYEDGSVAMWDVRQPESWTCRARYHDEAIAGLDYCCSTRRGLSGSVDGSLVMWDGGTMTKTASASVEHGISCVRARQDGKLFAVGCCNRCINVYSGRRKMTPLVSVCSHSETVSCLAFNSGDNRLAVGSRDKTVSMWSLYRDAN